MLVAVALYLARAPLLTALAEYLTIEDALRPADVIFVFAGDADARPLLSADLYRQGLAPRIVIPRPENLPAQDLGALPNVTDAAVLVMRRLGVPETAIVVLTKPGGSTSTIDDARMFRVYAQRHGVDTVLVVTSAFHTRRARWVLRRALDGLDVTLIMAPAADPRFDETNWWRTEAGLLSYVQEYLKWLHNATQTP